jgi:hypothetical protein
MSVTTVLFLMVSSHSLPFQAVLLNSEFLFHREPSFCLFGQGFARDHPPFAGMKSGVSGAGTGGEAPSMRPLERLRLP